MGLFLDQFLFWFINSIIFNLCFFHCINLDTNTVKFLTSLNEIQFSSRSRILRLVENPASINFVGSFTFLTDNKAPDHTQAQWLLLPHSLAIQRWHLYPSYAKLSHGASSPGSQSWGAPSSLAPPWSSVSMVFPIQRYRHRPRGSP